MSRHILIVSVLAIMFTCVPALFAAGKPAPSALDFTVNNIDGQSTDLSQYKGKVVLIVNVASKCGFTPQYAGLEKVYQQYKDQGFVIIGFPANNFHSQEPGTNEEIKAFCTGKYNVTFPMMAKISVKGDDIAPIYKFLTEQPKSGVPGEITWNFNKFLIGRDGQVIARFPSSTKPDSAIVTGSIEGALK
ncbi:MAG TPA: glutathione peroxidase [Tepidisphaeraceae bacterium]